MLLYEISISSVVEYEVCRRKPPWAMHQVDIDINTVTIEPGVSNGQHHKPPQQRRFAAQSSAHQKCKFLFQ